MVLLFRELGALVFMVMCTICKTAKCYMGFILERAEKEALERLTCAAEDFQCMGHKKGTSPESFLSFLPTEGTN